MELLRRAPWGSMVPKPLVLGLQGHHFTVSGWVHVQDLLLRACHRWDLGSGVFRASILTSQVPKP